MSDVPRYAGFLGSWELIPEACEFEQGLPPIAGAYDIRADADGELVFEIAWTDGDGKEDRADFRGRPDGRPAAFSGGGLADALTVRAVSARELTTVATYRGAERMIAQRQLDESGQAMRVIQAVRFESGERLVNISVYRKIRSHLQ